MFRKKITLISLLLLVAIGLTAFRAVPVVAPSINANAEPQSASHNAQADAPPFFDGNAAYDLVALQLGFGHRPTSSPALEATRQAMIEILENAGWEVVLQPFDHVANGQTYHGMNIVAKKGEGPITIIGSHYDSRLVADNDPVADNWTKGVPGANDGASSTAVVLELANVITEYYTTNEQIWLTFFDAEDNGRIPGWDWILGSTYMASHLDELGTSRDQVRFMLLLDMVGEAEEQQFRIEANSLASAPEEVVAIWQIAGILGYEDYFVPIRRGPITDDHLPFIQQGIPAVDIIDLTYTYWHTVGDTLDKVSAESLDRVGDVVEMYLYRTHRISLSE